MKIETFFEALTLRSTGNVLKLAQKKKKMNVGMIHSVFEKEMALFEQ